MVQRNRATISHARQMRSALTIAEKALWEELRAKRFAGVKFTRQVPIGPYVADFAARRHRLVIELDGGQQALDVERDAVRTAFLESQGFRVIRFWNSEVLANMAGVLTVIAEALKEPPLPIPPPMGGR